MLEISVPAREELFENPMGAMDFLLQGAKKKLEYCIQFLEIHGPSQSSCTDPRLRAPELAQRQLSHHQEFSYQGN